MSFIPRKPVGARGDVLSTPSVREHEDLPSYEGVAATSRISSQYIDNSCGFISTFSPDTGYHGNDIRDHSDQGIPLMEMSAGEAAPKNDSSKDLPQGVPKNIEGNEVHLEVRDAKNHSTWLPMALRWPFMAFLFLVTAGLGILVLTLTIQSERHTGLGPVQNTSIFLFGWRFTPTLFAVIFTLLLMSTFNGVRRTEVYARLSHPEGCSAQSSLFYKPRLFWYDPYDAISKRKKEATPNWALFYGSTVYILSLLIISPFSAAFLSPAEVSISRDTTFSRLATSVASPMALATDDSVFFRTISSILLNTTTSAWLNENYAVLPFWLPSLGDVPFDSLLSSNEDQWTANTTVYETTLECQTMNLLRFSNYSLNQTTHVGNKTGYAPLNLTSFILESEDRCSFGLAAFPPSSDSNSIFAIGGGWWSTSPDYSYASPWPPNNGTVEGFNSSNPMALNASSECGNRTLFFLAAKETYGQIFQAKGQICASNYFYGNVPVTVVNKASSSDVTFDSQQFDLVKQPIDPSIFNISAFENVFLSQNWSTKFQPPDASTNPTLAIRSEIGGPLILVGAQNNFDIEAMVNNPSLVEQAQRVKQRLLGESMQSIFRQIGTQKADSVSGRVFVNEERIVASFVIGILLTSVLLISALMIPLVWYHTRLTRRPLNLTQNPNSTLAIASIVRVQPSTRALFENLDRSSAETMIKQLDGYVFFLRNGVLYAHDVSYTHREAVLNIDQTKGSDDWRPKVLRGWLLALLLLLLTSLVIGLAVIFSKFRTSGLYQSFLVSGVNIKVDSKSLEALAPYSIIPTLIAVCVKLWWSSVDETFRRLQPYISMAQDQTQSTKATTLSYLNSPLGWAAGKAARHRHWLLTIVAVGAVLSEIFTVGMSALWNRSPGVRSHVNTLVRTSELRSVPAIFEVPPPSAHGYSASIETQNSKAALSWVYGNLLTGWLYASINEGVYNSTPAPWMQDDWAFVPADLDSISVNSGSNLSSTTNSSQQLGSIVNATFTTPAIRATLECTQFDMSNTSAWLNTLDFTNRSAWRDPAIPTDLKIGYELKLGLSMNQSFNGSYKYYDDENPYFSFFSTGYRLQCCGNETNGTEAAIGYWSIAEDSIHTSVVVKWLTGHPFPVQFNDSVGLNNWDGNDDYGGHIHWVWKDIPKVTALNCTPVFENTNASVSVDVSTGIVQNYTILDTPAPDEHALAYDYVQVNVSTGVPYSLVLWTGSGYQISPGSFVNNVTVSYGYLFHDALLGAANSARTGNDPTGTFGIPESLTDRTFNFRLPGLNVDFMSYTSLSLVNNNISALLSPDTLGNVSSTVFSLFFKHFVHDNTSSAGQGMYMNGSWGLQPRNSVIPSDLGGTIASLSKVHLQDSFKAWNTSPTVEAIVDHRVQQLDLSSTAFILCLSILGFLMLATAVILGWHAQYLEPLPRDVDTLGSILGFVYASEKLMALSKDRTLLEGKTQDRELVSMGWFMSGGKRRWGVEVVGEDDMKDEPINVSTGNGKRGDGYEQVVGDSDLGNLVQVTSASDRREK